MHSTGRVAPAIHHSRSYNSVNCWILGPGMGIENDRAIEGRRIAKSETRARRHNLELRVSNLGETVVEANQ